jgi:hypothetical protein
MPAAGGAAEQVTHQGGHVSLESADGKTLYYVKGEDSPLFALPVAGGSERKILDAVFRRAFVVVEDGIYYIAPPGKEQLYSLQFYQFSTGTSRLLTNIEGPLFNGLSVSPDRNTILFPKGIAAGADLMLIENFR